MPAVLNYTTAVAARRTVGEMADLLARHGATGVMTRYDGGHPLGLAFELPTPHGRRQFELPVDVKAVLSALTECRRLGEVAPRYVNLEQARRVAWRIAKDWLEAQLALVQARMAQLDQVMLPYMRVSPDVTLYDAYRADATRLGLPAGEA